MRVRREWPAERAALPGCRHDKTTVPAATEGLFESMFPAAGYTTWMVEGDYYVASFEGSTGIRRAWYDGQGTWFLTETRVAPDAVPDAVKKAFDKAFQVKNYTVNGIEYVEPALGNACYLYRLGIGDKTMDLQISEAGVTAIVPTE